MAKITVSMIEQILQLTGGSENIIICGNCMTRLRLTLRDREQIQLDNLKKIPGVLGVVNGDDQLQIILGPGKAQTASEMMNTLLNAQPRQPQGGHEQADLQSLASQNKQQMKAKQNSAVHNFLTKFATIFTPLIPGFIAAGLLLGFATLMQQTLVVEGVTPAVWLKSLIAYMKVFSIGLFTFLSILIGYNTQKAFGGTGVNGAIIASLFILRYVPEGTVGYYAGMSDFFGMVIDPRGNIIGVLLACIMGAWIERQVRRVIPDNLDMILTSTITLLITGAITFVVIMPVGGELFKGMSWLFMHLNGNPFGTAILAGLFLISVVFGIHQGFVPVYFALMDAQGFNSLFPILAMAGAGQVGASLALFARSPKGSLLRTQIKGAIFPGLLGIGEPLIYGVTLPRLKPFVTACLGGAVGGFFIGLVAWMGLPIGLNTVFGPSGLVSIPLMTSAKGIFAGMLVYVAGIIISYIAGFVLTWLFGSKNVDLS
ncbi:PTS N-acetylmuramic acid transporter subunit IIBC [Yersinia massiliensis]|jgi:N-acetylmuramic acid-specific PTS system IIC component|uniref:PTS system N-acetylmuramic acid-specific EIIBC component n=1 Tax=Yersinia massiliensis TaxID=419257 RepID=A0A2R4NTF0_9GAMM|nr:MULTISPECIES: PTS N-acetylmuramic acid transporter subunit IIBC [Yersinia]HEC1652319.1 PTS N-acetylmuramic acid transporter subunit IIBC [Yersinia enterocolitica]AVX39411.1 PTS N-acetylmuramic acid transporter subunits IIBC [Yersinia massiliensis]MDA5546948.1 PTS N-acetylmuramic acid transporter subunit IIBC [Yersinia massiliensis]NIL26619.1 PTS N-acetylmuramic acid transporter subunit IIBC [Yersinia massiliensis]OWF74112.1 PTS N-acetylmuramic acid transporter subunits IIBC [Yersinia freder